MKSKMKPFARTAFALLIGSALAWTSAIPLGDAGGMTRQVSAAPACPTGNHGLTLTSSTQGDAPRFQAIQFLSGKVGRAAGNGFMIGTSDAGCHWQKIYSGSYSFLQMQFLSNSLGYVVAETNPGKGPKLLLRTANGGASYKLVPNGGQQFNRVSFQSVQVGTGYTNNGAYATWNAGQTWRRIPTPSNTRGMQFMTPTKGWAVVLTANGYDVRRTTNGGQTWMTKFAVKSSSKVGGAIYGADSKDVWVLLYGGSGMSQTSYSLFHTKDNGEHWKQVVSNSTAGGGPAPGPAYPAGKLPGPKGAPSDMQTPDKATAYLAAGSGAMDNISLGRTLNAGSSWSNLKAVPGFTAKLSFPSAKNGWMAVTSVTPSAVYATTDSGKTWVKKFTLP